MSMRSKKPTLEQVRTLFPFEVPTLASNAGVETDTIYYALQHAPISKQDAGKDYRGVIATNGSSSFS